jgi:GAF domain-containing protein
MPEPLFEEYGSSIEQQLASLACLDEIGCVLASMPTLIELFGWLAERVPLALPDADRCTATVKFGGEIYGSSDATGSGCRLAEPIQRDGRQVGEICVAYDRPHVFGQAECHLLATVAERASAYVQVRGLIDEAQARAVQLEVLYELGRSLSAHLKMEQVLEEIYKGVSQLVDASNFYIGLYDRERNVVTFPLNVTESVVDRHISVIPADAGLTGHVLRTAESLLIEKDVAGWLEQHGIEVVGELAACWLGVPLLIGGEAQGIMAVQDYTTPSAFTEPDRAMLAAIASQAAVAIQNAQLFAEIETRARHEQALREITSRVRGSTDPDAIVRIAVQELGTVLGRRAFVWLGDLPEIGLPDAERTTKVPAQLPSVLDLDGLFQHTVTTLKERLYYYHAQVFRLEPALGAAVLVCGYGEAGQQMVAAGHSLRLRRGVVGTAAASGEPVLVPDVLKEPGWLHNPYLPDTKGELAVPIRLGERILGVVDVQSDVAGVLGKEDQALLELISEPLAFAIESAALQQEMEYSLCALEAASQEATAEESTADGQRSGSSRGYLYDRVVVEPVNERWTSELRRALQRDSATEGGDDRSPAPIVSQLVAQGESLGVLGVYADPGHSLSEQEVQLVQMVSGQVAAALDNARLSDTTRAALSEARTLYRFGELVSRETDESSICESVSLALVEDLGYTSSAIWVLDAGQDALVEVARTGEAGTDRRGIVSLSDAQNLVVRAVQSRGAAIASRVRPAGHKGDAGLSPEADLRETAISGSVDRAERSAAVPILADSGPLGAIQVSRPSDSPEVGDRDMRILEAVAIQAANAIQRARLLEQTQEALSAADAATRRYLRDAWDSFLEGRAAGTQAYVAGPEGVHRDGGLWLSEMQTALACREAVSVIAPAEGANAARSSVALPLMVRGEVIGVVDLYREGSKQQWSEREQELVRALVEEIGETLEGERQFAQTRVTLAETERMYQASQRISAADEQSEILETVRDIIASTGADQVAVFTFPRPATDGVPAEQSLSAFWARDGEEPIVPPDSTSAVDDLPVPYSMSRHKALIVPDLGDGSQLDPALREPLLTRGFRALAAVPLAVGDEWLGYALALVREPHSFTPGQARVCESVARQAAIALRSARLYEEAQRRARREQLIREITSKMRGTVDLETILNTAVEELGRALGVSRAFVRLGTGPVDAPPPSGSSTDPAEAKARVTASDDTSMPEGRM